MKEDALFSNIVYRLDYLENRVPWVKKGFYWFSAICLGIVFLLSVVSQFVSANNILWIDPFLHSLFESYCGIIALIIVYLVYREYKSSGKRSNLLLFLAFFSMGVFDFFHAFSNHSVTLFVWFHSLSAFSGGGFFLWSAFSIPRNAKDPPWLRRVFAGFGVTVTLASAVVLTKYVAILPSAVALDISHYTPVALSIRGEFTGHLVVVNLFSALFFLVGGILYMGYFRKTNDLLYHIFALSALLFFESELLFAFSRLWDPSWWYWHIIKLIIYVGLVVGLAHGLTRTFSELRESRTRLTGAVEELRHAYEDLKETQTELLEAEKFASVGRMAATIAHEIRNPLGAINNSIGIFKRHKELVGDDRELMDIAENEIGRLNGIISDFLDYAKPSPMNKSFTDINALIEETLLLFTCNGNPSVKVHKYLERDLPFVLIDRNAIKQCLWNIVINATQAMSSGGTLTVKTRCLTRIEGNEYGSEVRIIIRDSGVGMSEEVLSRAFQPFYSTKAKGTGLGLAIVQRIVRQHGGDVSLSSSPRNGTEVEISIPVSRGGEIANRGGRNVGDTNR